MTITATPDGVSRPTAGALRLVERRSTEPTTVNVREYVTRISAHCPYLAPSITHGLTGWTVYQIADDDPEAVEAELFHAGVQAAEWVRQFAARPQGALVCENVVILHGEGIDHRELLMWPHWALKNLYGPVGIMFGKFWAGEVGTDRHGHSIPVPTFSFLPVRTAIRPRDPRFLAETPDLAATLAAAVDDGRDVFEQLPNDWKTVREWSRSLPPARPRR